MSTVDNSLDFQVKEGETLLLTATLLGADGTPADLTGKAVVFSMRPAGSQMPIIDDASCTISGDPTLGVVTYSGQAADTTTRTGDMEAEFTVTGGGVTQRFPNAKGAYLAGFITPMIG